MKKKITGLLIDPQRKSIETTELENSLSGIYKLLDCTMIEAPVRFPNGDCMYCDEEAWLHYDEELKPAGFMFPDWRSPILGKALIVGSTPSGNDKDCKSKVDDFVNIKWVPFHIMRTYGQTIGII